MGAKSGRKRSPKIIPEKVSNFDPKMTQNEDQDRSKFDVKITNEK